MDERGADFLVNDAIKDYIFDLHQATRFSRIQSEVDALYGAKFQELSKTYYGDKTAWPSPATISNLVPSPTTGKGSDDFFLCFYKEMADRHFFANGRPTAKDSVDAWNNYCTLFEIVIAQSDLGMTINEQWAFEVIHEFVYSFQGFCQYRGDLSRRDPDDVATLRSMHPDVWSVSKVASILHKVIACSNVEAVLVGAKKAGVSTSSLLDQSAATVKGGFHVPFSVEGGVKPPSKLHFDLGYFALFGLSRLECLLGDYHGCLASVQAVDLFSESEYYHKVFACYLQLYYHCGVSYLLSRRSKDAIRTLGHVVAHVSRLAKTGSLHHMAGVDEQSAKKTVERCSALLAIAVALTPGAKVEELVSGVGKEAMGHAFNDRVAVLQAAGTDGSEFEQLFEKYCPKFVSGALPSYAGGGDAEDLGGGSASTFEPVRRQVELLGKEAGKVAGHTRLRSFLKLYTAIEVHKLAKFQDQGSSGAGATSDEGEEAKAAVEEVRRDLVATKHLMSQVEALPGQGPLGASRQHKSALDVHFYVNEGGTVNVDDDFNSEGQGGGEDGKQGHDGFFMQEIHRAEAVARQVKEQAQRLEVAKSNAVNAALAKKGSAGRSFNDGGGDDYDDRD
eukprot:CAMPEP_0171702482 /NCGR_PEP_ID=MMETSP0991-20121206/11617_1 /TAXON_ID=483369 /ORGANISM="non described non described, Strain CCMP2098" /LENGTH=616 /DNA_ID=CAMNT_0012291823 /DNA_START=25 /DNA_END=1875 /DNA_ORIENTATION=-